MGRAILPRGASIFAPRASPPMILKRNAYSLPREAGEGRGGGLLGKLAPLPASPRFAGGGAPTSTRFSAPPRRDGLAVVAELGVALVVPPLPPVGLRVVVVLPADLLQREEHRALADVGDRRPHVAARPREARVRRVVDA